MSSSAVRLSAPNRPAGPLTRAEAGVGESGRDLGDLGHDAATVNIQPRTPGHPDNRAGSHIHQRHRADIRTIREAEENQVPLAFEQASVDCITTLVQ